MLPPAEDRAILGIDPSYRGLRKQAANSFKLIFFAVAEASGGVADSTSKFERDHLLRAFAVPAKYRRKLRPLTPQDTFIPPYEPTPPHVRRVPVDDLMALANPLQMTSPKRSVCGPDAATVTNSSIALSPN